MKRPTETIELFCSGCGKNVGVFFIKGNSPSHVADEVLGRVDPSQDDDFLCNDCRPVSEELQVSLKTRT